MKYESPSSRPDRSLNLSIQASVAESSKTKKSISPIHPLQKSEKRIGYRYEPQIKLVPLSVRNAFEEKMKRRRKRVLKGAEK